MMMSVIEVKSRLFKNYKNRCSSNTYGTLDLIVCQGQCACLSVCHTRESLLFCISIDRRNLHREFSLEFIVFFPLCLTRFHRRLLTSSLTHLLTYICMQVVCISYYIFSSTRQPSSIQYLFRVQNNRSAMKRITKVFL